MLEQHKAGSGQPAAADLLTDFQLQIEHSVDLQQRRFVLFVDAAVNCVAPFELTRLRAERDDSFTTHAMSPASVLAVYETINQCEAPPAYLLSIRAYEFGLGKAMSEQAVENLQKAFAFVLEIDWAQQQPVFPSTMAYAQNQ
jgi:hydrogenase maturation protease